MNVGALTLMGALSVLAAGWLCSMALAAEADPSNASAPAAEASVPNDALARAEGARNLTIPPEASSATAAKD